MHVYTACVVALKVTVYVCGGGVWEDDQQWTDLGGLSNYSMQVWCEALRPIDHLADLSMLHGWNTMKDLLHEVLWGEGGRGRRRGRINITLHWKVSAMHNMWLAIQNTLNFAIGPGS